MVSQVELVPYRGEQVYDKIITQLDIMRDGEVWVFSDPAPDRRTLFSVRLNRVIKWRKKRYSIKTRQTKDGRLLVKKIGQ